MAILLPDDAVSLSVLRKALTNYGIDLGLHHQPSGPEYDAVVTLISAIILHQHEPPVFGEFAPLECAAGDGEIIDHDRAVSLPNAGYAHDADCASQWSQMQEAK